MKYSFYNMLILIIGVKVFFLAVTGAAMLLSCYYIARFWKRYVPKRRYIRLGVFVVCSIALDAVLAVECYRMLFVNP